MKHRAHKQFIYRCLFVSIVGPLPTTQLYCAATTTTERKEISPPEQDDIELLRVMRSNIQVLKALRSYIREGFPTSPDEETQHNIKSTLKLLIEMPVPESEIKAMLQEGQHYFTAFKQLEDTAHRTIKPITWSSVNPDTPEIQAARLALGQRNKELMAEYTRQRQTLSLSWSKHAELLKKCFRLLHIRTKPLLPRRLTLYSFGIPDPQ